jgi:hypothetical protein
MSETNHKELANEIFDIISSEIDYEIKNKSNNKLLLDN